jgi:predicted RND superfamily exporter protein
MGRSLDKLSWLITVRPYITLAVILIITVVLAAGASQRAELDDTNGFLPTDSPIALANDEISELFGESGGIITSTLIFQGEPLTPEALAQMGSLTDRIFNDIDIADLLVGGHQAITPATLIGSALQVDDFAGVSQEAIDQASVVPEIRATLDAIVGTDEDGTQVTISTVRLRDSGDDRPAAAELRIDELADAAEGPLRVSTVSPAVMEEEYSEANRTGIAPLIGIALVLIAALLLFFLRSVSDLLLALLGLVVSLIWLVGLEGWLGPKGLGVTGRPSGISVMIPIIVIGLTVDYAIQALSHYREQRAGGLPVNDALRASMRIVIVPLSLAAVTTIGSLFVQLLSPIPAIGDFGIVAGLGVGMSLIVMLTLIPAARAILDRRREANGTLKAPALVADAIPYIGPMAAALGRSVSRRPMPYIAVIAAISIGLGIASTGIESRFTIHDILPTGSDTLADLNTLDAAFGGSTEVFNVLIEAEATDTRTMLNLQDLRNAFEDDQRRPGAAAGPIEQSFELLASDWVEDSDQPDDRYDAELAALYQDATAGLHLVPAQMQTFLDQLEERHPEIANYLVNDPSGIDQILVQFPAYGLDTDKVRLIQSDLEEIWQGDDRTLTATSDGIISVAVTDEITRRQTESIATTIVVALAILMVFYWTTLRQPALAIVAVGPIVLVLLWVLGTMALVGIPYTLTTSIITALSIGIGVDYTIHVIHRYREEFSRSRNPEDAAIRTLATTGSALLGSALTTALGLGVLAFGPTLAIQQFGVTAAITIAYALIISTILVPPAMTIWGAYQNMRLRSALERSWAELDAALED